MLISLEKRGLIWIPLKILGGENMLSMEQLQLIKLHIIDDMAISEALSVVQIPKSTYYEWRKGESKVGKEFNKAFEEALNLKVAIYKKNVKNDIRTHIEILNNIAAKGRNENARVNAITKLWSLSELEKQELNLNINGSDASKNDLLEKWKEKQQGADTPEE